MTPSQLTRRDALVGTIAAPFLAGRAAGAAEPAGTVEALRGEATAQATSGVRPLAQDASVLVGDLVATGAQSAIALRLGAATQVRLGPEARLRIDRFLIKAGGIVALANGAMVFDHDPAAGPTEVSVRSPFGLIAVRGTRFFAGPSDPRLPALMTERLPASVHGIVAAADRALAKRFDLLGYRDLSFGDPIDWHLDPVAKRQAPLRHWTLLDPLDAATVGDSKVVWELNRHQWLVGLGQAYRLTGDERYPAMFADTIRDWLRANPPGLGINWASSLEVAFRLISWCWALSLFRGATPLTTELRAVLVGSIAAHASRVERYLSYYFSPNTHLTGEALGLFYAGTLFPDMPGAVRWQRTGLDG